MKLPRVSWNTLARWVGVAALLAAPTFIRYEITSHATFACTRDGALAGTCHGEPTLRQSLGLDTSWEAPRVWFLPVTPISDIGMAIPSGGDHYLALRSVSLVEMHEIPLDDEYSPSDERTAAVRLNSFLRDPRQRSFRLRQPGDFNAGYLLFYVAAGIVAFFALRRSIALRTTRWVEAVELIPSTRVTAYRG